MDYKALKSELAGDAYAKLSHEAAAALLNSQEVTVDRGEVSRSDFVRDLPLILANLVAQTANQDAVIAAKAKGWLTIYQLTVTPVDLINTASAPVQGMLKQLMADGFLTKEQFDTLTKKTISRAQEILGRPATADDVNNAITGEWD